MIPRPAIALAGLIAGFGLGEALVVRVEVPAPGPVTVVREGLLCGDLLREAIQAMRREMAKVHHADVGGQGSRMAEINAAADDGLVECGT